MKTSRMTVGLSLVLGAAVTLTSATSWAYSCITNSCSRYCDNPVPYKLGTPSADLGPQSSEAEVKKAMELWTKPACSSLKVQYGGTTSEAAGNANAVVAWVESGWSGSSGTIGTTTSRISGGCLRAHMRLNGVNFRWVPGNTASRSEVNAVTILAHEGGHYFGLGHSSVNGALMEARYGGGIIPLSADDEAGICKIYPGGGGAPTPDVPGMGGAPGSGGANGAGGSPGTGGSNGGGTGNGSLCSPCQRKADCSTGFCLSNNQTGERFCSVACGGGCPSGWNCVPADNTGGVNVCVPPSLSCAGYMPPTPNPGLGGSSGGMGAGGSSGSGGSGVPMGGGMTANACDNDDDCASGQSCSASGQCVANDGGDIISPDGEVCAVNTDCQSRLCLEADGKSFCSRVCASNADCVSGFACRQRGNERVCLPVDEEASNGGASGSGGQSGGGGRSGGTSGQPSASAGDEGGSGCTMAGRSHPARGAWLLVFGLVGAGLARRRLRRRADRNG